MTEAPSCSPSPWGLRQSRKRPASSEDIRSVIRVPGGSGPSRRRMVDSVGQGWQTRMSSSNVTTASLRRLSSFWARLKEWLALRALTKFLASLNCIASTTQATRETSKHTQPSRQFAHSAFSEYMKSGVMHCLMPMSAAKYRAWRRTVSRALPNIRPWQVRPASIQYWLYVKCVAVMTARRHIHTPYIRVLAQSMANGVTTQGTASKSMESPPPTKNGTTSVS
mmetsp:Transcript_30890/g.83698  ORF Transcript_30890/g.83698 Transcript_30890/m.83698 type:complete len:223 (+) Transcript_30890:1086-1754(+)